MMFAAASQPTSAEERAETFVTALRARGWHDVALEYFDSADQDPLATDLFLAHLDYHRGVTLHEMAQKATSQKQRSELLKSGASSFEQFASANSQSDRYLESLAQAGQMRMELVLHRLEQLKRLPLSASAQREQLQVLVREALGAAQKPLQRVASDAADAIKSLPKSATIQSDPKYRGQRERLEAKRAEARFLLARLDFENARTHAPDSQLRADALDKAVDAFAKLHKDYREKLIGFYSRLYEGRCHQERGEHGAALRCFDDLVDQPSTPSQDFRRLIARAYRHRAESYLAVGNYDKAIEECNQWLDDSRQAELKEPEWLTVAYQLALAYHAQAAEPVKSRDASRWRSDARRLLRSVARHPNEFQHDARTQLATRGTGNTESIAIKTFDDAFTAGKDALERMNASNLAVRLAKENNPASVPDLSDQAKEYQRDATRYFRIAIDLADPKAKLESLLACRYYLCLLYWEADQLHDAAVIGEFLARRYPDNQHAPVAAKVSLAAYERLYKQARKNNDSNVEFELNRLHSIAKYLVARWPTSPEAASAITLLLDMALRDNRLDEAEAMLAKLPPESRHRAELSLGGTLWTRFLKQSSSNAKNAAKLKQRARELLANGTKNLPTEKNPSAAEAAALLYFAQLLLSDGEAQQAVKLLENPSYGPLTLVERSAAVAQQTEFMTEVYKVALRSYLSLRPPQRERAQAMMNALEQVIEEAGAEEKILSIYVRLGVELQRQVRNLTEAKKTDEASSVAAAFEDLLQRVTDRKDAAKGWNIQHWIAQTSLQLGQGLRGTDALRYFQQAEQGYAALIAQAEADPQFAPRPLAVLAARKQLADCLRLQKKFSDSFEQTKAILAQRPNLLELQIAAATTLEQWGLAEKNSEKIEQSIRGAAPQANKKNLIWGWLRIAAVADQAERKARQSNEAKQQQLADKYHDLFFQARYEVAKNRFAAAKLSDGPRQNQQLHVARKNLLSMQRLYPKLGGPKWKPQYETLLNKINKAIGEDAS